MYKLSITALGLVVSSIAAQSTTTLLLPGFDPQPLVGSVIASDSTATTYAIACASGTDDSDCGVPTSFTFTQGPSTVHYILSENDQDEGVAVTADLGCVLSGSSSAVCSATDISVNGTTTSSSASTAEFTGDLTDQTTGIGGLPVTITAGAVAATTTAASTTTAGSASTASSGSGAKSTGQTSSASKASATGTGATSSSTGGVAMITGNARWVVGGAAAVGLACAGL